MQKDDQELKKQSPTLLIKSRLSASLLFDSLWKWRQYHINAQTLDKTSKNSEQRLTGTDIPDADRRLHWIVTSFSGSSLTVLLSCPQAA